MDSRDQAIRSGPADRVYIPEKQAPQSGMTLLVRAGDDPKGVVPALLAMIRGIDRRLPVASVHTLDEGVEAGISSERIAGVTFGGFLAFASGRLLQGVLFGVAATDPLTMAGSILVLVAAALVATVMPLRRVMRVDPMVLLRSE